MKCDICGKTAMVGRNVSHSKRHTRRLFRPNIRPLRVNIDGCPATIHICMRCLRTQQKLAPEKA
ncbi:MAG TPA: 50S ribosomal protein L28 [Dehalococcoidia bacterium]|nr:50S ribosomal protein L28 [Dehalococcoidia bacterium]